MHEIWPLGQRKNSVVFATEPPAELIKALRALSPQATRARCLITILAKYPDQVLGISELHRSCVGIDPSFRTVQGSSFSVVLRNTLEQLSQQEIDLPICREPIEIEPPAKRKISPRLGWVWRMKITE